MYILVAPEGLWPRWVPECEGRLWPLHREEEDGAEFGGGGGGVVIPLPRPENHGKRLLLGARSRRLIGGKFMYRKPTFFGEVPSW